MRIQNYKKCFRFLDSYFKNIKIQYAIGINNIRLGEKITVSKLK